LFAASNADTGKEVEIRYVAEDEKLHVEKVALAQGAGKRTRMQARKIDALILPTDLTGIVRLEQSDGRVLSEYAPYEHVPSYKRVKVTGAPCDAVVAVTASRKYTPLYSDNDIAEFDDRNVIEHVGRHIFYAESGADGPTMNKSEFHRVKAIEMLHSKAGRTLGLGKNDSFRGPPLKRTRVAGNLGGHIIG
jgi:hypothetical protein